MSHYNVIISVPSHVLSESVSAEVIARIQLERKVFSFLSANLQKNTLHDFETFPYSLSDLEIAVEAHVEETLRPFGTEDPSYQEFFSVEEEERERYETGSDDCVCLPNGTICRQSDYLFSNKYTVSGGKVFQKNFGRLMADINTRTHRLREVNLVV